MSKEKISLNGSIEEVSHALAENVIQYLYSDRKDDTIETRVRNCLNEFLNTNTYQSQKEKDKMEFYKHFDKWNVDTYVKSSFKEIFSHPDYKAIVDMGERAVPFIIEVIKNQPDYIVQALNDIKGYKPKTKTSLVTDLCKEWIKILS